ncbi:Conserved hypothetical protein [Xanthomonas citri pv. fuscans]|nr:Conserved hypothetical protein [Xanthomonas citri pv. fuscans]
MHCRSQRECPRRLSAYGRKHIGKTGLSRMVSARQYPRISVRARIQRSTLSRADWPVSVDVELVDAVVQIDVDCLRGARSTAWLTHLVASRAAVLTASLPPRKVQVPRSNADAAMCHPA